MNCLSHSGKTSHAPALSAEKEMLPVVYNCCKHHCDLQPLLQLEWESAPPRHPGSGMRLDSATPCGSCCQGRYPEKFARYSKRRSQIHSTQW